MAVVGRANDIGEGQVIVVDHEGERVAIANVGGELYAFGEECTHRGCSLSEGDLEGTRIICDCHGGTFDITTGRPVKGPPDEPLKTFKVTVVNGDVSLE